MPAVWAAVFGAAVGEQRCSISVHSYSTNSLENNCEGSRRAKLDDRQEKSRCMAPAFLESRRKPRPGFDQLRWLLIRRVISNIETWLFLKISRSLASALIMVRLVASWRPFFLM